MPLKITQPQIREVARPQPLTPEALAKAGVLLVRFKDRNSISEVFVAFPSLGAHAGGQFVPGHPDAGRYADILSLNGPTSGEFYRGQSMGTYEIVPVGEEVTVTLSNLNSNQR